MTDRPAGTALQVRRLFDANAAGWPEKYTPGGPLVGRLSRLAGAASAEITAGGTVLDLGCGTGALAGAVTAAGMRATGCDISGEMLRIAKAADLGREVDWIQLEPGWQSLPFTSGTFDAVIASSVLEYVDEPTAVLRECGRVLRPGGVVTLHGPGSASPDSLARVAGRPGGMPAAGRHRRRPLAPTARLPDLPADLAAAALLPLVARCRGAGWLSRCRLQRRIGAAIGSSPSGPPSAIRNPGDRMTAVTVDVAGGPMGGAARFREEFYDYLQRAGRQDVEIIGAERYLDPAWLLRREVAAPARGRRRVALNNVGFIFPGGQRWTLLGNALHFLTDVEVSRVDPSLRTVARRQAGVVRLAARRSDVLIAPCSAMAERVAQILPSVQSRLVVRMHPVSAGPTPGMSPEPVILCPVLFSPYKHMVARLREWIAAVDDHIDPSVRMLVTAEQSEVPADLACHPRIELVGHLHHAELRPLWARSRAIYFPSGLESFGFPLAEARASGHAVIARDTAQSREIAGAALCGFTVGDAESLRHATELALAKETRPDPGPFDPDAYFNWMLGVPGAENLLVSNDRALTTILRSER